MMKKTIIVVIALSCIISCKTPVFDKRYTAYEAFDVDGRFNTYCACNHKGYFIITKNKIIWYITGHEEIQDIGKIISIDNTSIKFQRISDVVDNKEISKITFDGDYILVEEGKDIMQKGKNIKYKLQKTALPKKIHDKVIKYIKKHNLSLHAISHPLPLLADT